MRLRYLLIGLVVLLLPSLSSAELYRYTDERGVIHFTDNFIEIPENQRPKVEIITRPEETATPQVQVESDRPEKAGMPEGAAEADRSGGPVGARVPENAVQGVQPQRQFETLIQSKAELDKMYDALAIEKESLEKEQKTLKTVESIRAFQEKVNRFNQRLADYERQREAFQTQADAYNQAISK